MGAHTCPVAGYNSNNFMFLHILQHNLSMVVAPVLGNTACEEMESNAFYRKGGTRVSRNFVECVHIIIVSQYLKANDISCDIN